MPLVPLYAAVLAAKDSLRAMGVLKVRRLGWPVVSVGSLSVGGAGKTPVVIALVKALRARGWAVDVLSRGYGREGSGMERVAGAHLRQRAGSQAGDAFAFGRDGDAQRFGDEPVLIARAAHVPVWVGANRFALGTMAEETWAREQKAARAERRAPAARPNDHSLGVADDRAGSKLRRRSEDREPEEDDDDYPLPLKSGLTQSGDARHDDKRVHLLDDGFQHRQLARSFELVLVTTEDLDDTLLPAGNLREDFSALLRADAVVVRAEELKAVKPKLRKLTRPGTPLWTVERKLRFPAPLGVLSAGFRPVAFCAIARPEGFGLMLHEAGCGVIDTVVFGDHHTYTMEGIEHVVKVAKALRASGLVTTEKDAVKLTAAMREKLEAVGPLMVVGLEAEFLNMAEVMSEIEERLQ